ncbi:MAG: glycosyltransferase [Phycisphaerae bacterium]|nr:glycosyltransferase [Phycisphaerae bacterium]
MKVLMLGWEFPPHISGGLGTACFGMTRGLDEIGVEVAFVLPTAVPVDMAGRSHVKLCGPNMAPAAVGDLPVDLTMAGIGAAGGDLATGDAGEGTFTTVAIEGMGHVALHHVPAVLQAYATPETFKEVMAALTPEQQVQVRHVLERMQAEAEQPDAPASPGAGQQGAPQGASQAAPGPLVPAGAFDKGPGLHYGGDLMGQIRRYAAMVVRVAQAETFDVIHAHDWMTYPAGLAVAAASGKPLVVHVHSTEFDRSGENVNTQIYDIERAGMHGADQVVCVSYLTRNIAANRYGVPASKLDVVYNAVDLPADGDSLAMTPIRPNEKLVLFLGRVTMQKGPEYFLEAAKKVTEKFTNVRFVMAGSGDMIAQCVRQVADLKLGRYVTFTGFLRGDDVARIFRMADLYVMPSVSEPFGIAPLEALSHNVPVIISKQSGVSEVLTHVLKIDFWDVDEMANKILAVLRHPPLQRTLRQHGAIELRKFSWRDSAVKLRKIYSALVDAE